MIGPCGIIQGQIVVGQIFSYNFLLDLSISRKPFVGLRPAIHPCIFEEENTQLEVREGSFPPGGPR